MLSEGQSRGVCSSPEMAYRLECWCSRSRRLLWLLPRKLAGSVSEMCLRDRGNGQGLSASTECCSWSSLQPGHSSQLEQQTSILILPPQLSTNCPHQCQPPPAPGALHSPQQPRPASGHPSPAGNSPPARHSSSTRASTHQQPAELCLFSSNLYFSNIDLRSV